MATLVLTTLGTAIGGPLGGALGAMLGQAADARLFSPKGRAGPRLDELRVQTSSFGSPIPKLFGRMRVAGTVIWATDLVERRGRQSNGKGRGSSTTFSYSVSLAVALSSRPILRVGRIWAEGNLLRGAAGDFKSPTGFRLHSGGEDQPPDPLIAAAEGIGQCPAYRGLAYAVFEDLDLTPFGNRVPSLSFEVDADDAPLTLADPVGALLGPWQAAGAVERIAGCALGGGNGEEAVARFAGAVAIDRVPGVNGWAIGRAMASAVQPLSEPMGERMRDGRSKRPEVRHGGGVAVPQRISLASYDPARDFQTGLQQARVASGDAPVEALALPVAMAADDAKALCVRLANEAAVARRVTRWPQGFAAYAVPPGARVTLPGSVAAMLVDERRIDGAGVTLTLRNAPLAVTSGGSADSGRAVTAPDRTIGASAGHLFDLPSANESDRARGRLVLAAGGTGAGWRGAAVSVRASAGAPVVDAGTIGPVAVLGMIESVDAGSGSGLIDRHRAIVVALLNDAMMLENASDADLLGGTNLAMAGGELLQFGRAEPLGGRRWRLTNLLRGRLGTEDAVPGLASGAGLALVADPALMAVNSAGTWGGGWLGTGWSEGAAVLIEGQGDAVPRSLPVARHGRATRPLSPVHGVARWQGDGGLQLNWVRRSRDGFGWNDGTDAPLDERREHYRVTLTAGGSQAAIEVAEPLLSLSPAELARWRVSGATIDFAIVQLGERGESPPLTGAMALY